MSTSLSFTTASNDYKRRRVTKLESEFSSAYEPHQIVFGVFENSCSLWHRELIAVSADNTFEDLATILCDKVLPSVRGDDFGGNSVNAHLWYFEFGTENLSTNKSGTKWIYRMKRPYYDENDNIREFSADSAIGCLQLKCRMHARLTYDLGTTSTVFMKVLAIGELDKETKYPLILHLTPPITTIKRDILFPLTSDNLRAIGAQIDCSARFVSTAERDGILSAVPAFSAPEEVKLDALFPNFSRAFLHEKYTSFVIGLSSMITRPSDGSFLAMDGSQNTIMLAPIAFTSMNEFFAISEKAWLPNPALSIFRTGWVSRFVFPSVLSTVDDEAYRKSSERDPEEPNYGPKELFFRFNEAELEAAISDLASKNFDFSAQFPLTNQQFVSGKFRWASYQGHVLRVCVGRGTGLMSRESLATNILREWHGHKFTSLHELMCAIEASWLMPGDSSKPLGDVELSLDEDTGPSDPIPPDPPMLVRRDQVTLLPGSTGGDKSITAMAFGEKSGNSYFVFCGRKDGVVLKYDLNSNTCIKSVRVYSSKGIEGMEDLKGMPVEGLLYSANCKVLYAWSGSTKLSELSSTKCTIRNLIQVPSIPLAIVMGKYQKKTVLFISTRAFGDIWIMDTVSREFLGRYRTPRKYTGPGSALALSPNRYLVSVITSYATECVILWNLSSRELLKTMRVNETSMKIEYKQRMRNRILSVEGISISENTLVLLCNHGQFVTMIGLPDLNVIRYVDISIKGPWQDTGFICSMSSYGSTFLPVNQDFDKLIVYDAKKIRSLDDTVISRTFGYLDVDNQRRDRDVDYDDRSDIEMKAELEVLRIRGLADGVAIFPERASGPREPGRNMGGMVFKGEEIGFDDNDNNSNGVRISVINEMHIVGGYADGSVRVYTKVSNEEAPLWAPNSGVPLKHIDTCTAFAVTHDVQDYEYYLSDDDEYSDFEDDNDVDDYDVVDDDDDDDDDDCMIM